MDINKIYWHDGNLIDTCYTISEEGKSKLVLNAYLYESSKASERTKYRLICSGIRRINFGIDAIELKNNAFAGNMSNGYLKKNTLWLYFSDGVLEVVAKKFNVEPC